MWGGARAELVCGVVEWASGKKGKLFSGLVGTGDTTAKNSTKHVARNSPG